MRFDGEWLQFDDGIIRPIVRAEILADDGAWRALELLVDTGADHTVISANVLDALNLESVGEPGQIGGVGGLVVSIAVRTELRLTRDDGQRTIFRGEWVACTDHAALDMSVLGRDILKLFSLIVDERAETLAIIGGRHHYTIHSGS